MAQIAILLLSLFLSACGEVTGNEAGGLIERMRAGPNSFALAEQHCNKYGRHALITGIDPPVIFQCVN